MDHITNNDVACFNSLIWVNKAQTPRHLPVYHSDITIVVAQVGERFLSVVSTYIPCRSGRSEDDANNLQSRLDVIKLTYQQDCPELEIILTGDFNRWDTLCGGNQIASHSRQGEGEILINFVGEFNL